MTRATERDTHAQLAATAAHRLESRNLQRLPRSGRLVDDGWRGKRDPSAARVWLAVAVALLAMAVVALLWKWLAS